MGLSESVRRIGVEPGRVYRAFSLPGEVDNDKADARYEGGVLTLTLPKKGNGKSRRIMVS